MRVHVGDTVPRGTELEIELLENISSETRRLILQKTERVSVLGVTLPRQDEHLSRVYKSPGPKTRSQNRKSKVRCLFIKGARGI
jgi:hypothetical protein